MASRPTNRFVTAFHYLVLSKTPENPEDMGRAFIYFPLVGFILGAGLSAFYYVLSRILDENPASFLTLAVMFLLFRRKSQDADANYICSEPGTVAAPSVFSVKGGDALRISAPFFFFMLKYLSLTHIGRGWALGMLILLPTFSCWSLVYFTHSLVFSSTGESGPSGFYHFVRVREFWGASFFATAASVLFMELKGLFLLMFVSLWTAVFERFLLPKRRESLDAVLWTVRESNEVLVFAAAIVMRKVFAELPRDGLWL